MRISTILLSLLAHALAVVAGSSFRSPRPTIRNVASMCLLVVWRPRVSHRSFARYPVMRTLIRSLAVTFASALLGCGGDTTPVSPSPVAAPPPTSAPPPAPTFAGVVTETQTGAPVVGFTAVVNGSRVTISAPGYVTRETRLSASSVDLIREAGFDLDFYRRFARNQHEAPNELQIIRRQIVAPRIYLRTVDEAGQPIDSDTLTITAAGLLDAAKFTGGVFSAAGVERGTETREGQSGWITVKWLNPRQDGSCGRAQVGGTWIEFNYLDSRCWCSGWKIRPRTVRHELGHAMGYWHTGSPDDLMSGVADSRCDQQLSQREQDHSAIVYKRPIGNRDVDVDPVGVGTFQPRLVVD